MPAISPGPVGARRYRRAVPDTPLPARPIPSPATVAISAPGVRMAGELVAHVLAELPVW
jgi:hypothetical protein